MQRHGEWRKRIEAESGRTKHKTEIPQLKARIKNKKLKTQKITPKDFSL